VGGFAALNTLDVDLASSRFQEALALSEQVDAPVSTATIFGAEEKLAQINTNHNTNKEGQVRKPAMAPQMSNKRVILKTVRFDETRRAASLALSEETTDRTGVSCCSVGHVILSI